MISFSIISGSVCIIKFDLRRWAKVLVFWIFDFGLVGFEAVVVFERPSTIVEEMVDTNPSFLNDEDECGTLCFFGESIITLASVFGSTEDIPSPDKPASGARRGEDVYSSLDPTLLLKFDNNWLVNRVDGSTPPSSLYTGILFCVFKPNGERAKRDGWIVC
jgi:hypothetical protein